MDRLTEFLLDIIQGLFADWGLFVVLFGTMLENLLLLGLFVPGAVLLVLAGITAAEGSLDLRWALLLAFVGTSIGDTASYLMGRFGWKRALRHAEGLPFMATVQAALRRRTVVFVLSYHFFGYTRVLGPTMAGVSKIPFRRWYLIDALGAALWVTAYLGGGYILGRVGINFETAKAHVKVADRILAVVAVITVVVVLIVRARIHSRTPRLVEVEVEVETQPEEPGRGRRAGS